MEPEIQFCTTTDGVSIAYYELGSGLPLVYGAGSVSNLRAEVRDPGRMRWYERLGADFRLIRYDRRGTGSSDRGVKDYSVEMLQRDIEAIVEHLRLEQVAFFATGWSGPPAIAYAAAHPRRVSSLILYGTNASGRSTLLLQDETSEYLVERDWDLFTEILARQTYEWPDSERIRADAARIRDSVTQEGMRLFLEANQSWDVSHLLTEVRCPALVLYRPEWATRGGTSAIVVDQTRAVAQAIPGARLVALRGTSLAPYVGDTEEILSAMREFLGDRDGATRPRKGLPVGTAIILFADIVDSTALTERLGDAVFRERARALDDSLRAAITASGGTPIDGKLLGDGVLATFPAASQAIDAALRCAAAGNDGGLPLHLGIHAGDVIREANNVYGGAVNIASRISGLSAPGEVLVSDIVRGLARTSAGVTFEDRGEHALKGVADPQRVFAVRALSSRDGDGG
jgi:class 3 adenylate cyclase